jgi:hypothetical protein
VDEREAGNLLDKLLPVLALARSMNLDSMS